jgi:hypothetical protein
MKNVAVDWYTNPHTVDNGGHGVPTLVIFKKLQNLTFVQQGRLVLRSVIFVILV